MAPGVAREENEAAPEDKAARIGPLKDGLDRILGV